MLTLLSEVEIARELKMPLRAIQTLVRRKRQNRYVINGLVYIDAKGLEAIRKSLTKGELITIAEFAELLGLSRERGYQLAHQQPELTMRDGYYLIPRSVVDRMRMRRRPGRPKKKKGEDNGTAKRAKRT